MATYVQKPFSYSYSIEIEEKSKNLHIVRFGDLEGPAYELGFSYETLVYFGYWDLFREQDPTEVRENRGTWRMVICINEWGPTTGKHLNFFDGGATDAKRARIPQEELQAFAYTHIAGIGKALLTDLNTAADAAANAMADL